MINCLQSGLWFDILIIVFSVLLALFVYSFIKSFIQNKRYALIIKFIIIIILIASLWYVLN